MKANTVTIAEQGRLSVDLLPDRGLDLGAVEFDGLPVQWIRTPTATSEGGWFAAWPGGLITTCGLHNVGAASEGFGLHGAFALTPARDAVIETDARGATVARGTIVDGALKQPHSHGAAGGARDGDGRCDKRVRRTAAGADSLSRKIRRAVPDPTSR